MLRQKERSYVNNIRYGLINLVKPNRRNARRHVKKQIRKIADSITAFGFTSPILIDEFYVLIAGEGRWQAALSLGMTSIPAIMIDGLSEAKKLALMLADNRIAQDAGWDRERLAIELAALPELLIADGLDVSVTGFEPAEIDILHADFEDPANDPADEIDASCLDSPPITRIGDLWRLGKHSLLCGDARNADDLDRLLGGDRAHTAFLDVPYNVKVSSIGGRGAKKHREFAMASGEMPREDYIVFLVEALGMAAAVSVDGAVHFVCMDWRHIEELVTSSREVYGGMLNLIGWARRSSSRPALKVLAPA